MDPIASYMNALRGVGILNHEDMEVSGENGFLRRYLPKAAGGVVVDAGAHHGVYTQAVLAVRPRARVTAIEAHPANFAILERNLAGTGARLVHCALGDQDGGVTIHDYRDRDGSGHASLYQGVIETIHGAPSVAHVVPARRLDDLAVELGLGRIDLLKIDTEGHELAVLRGAAKMIATGLIDAIQFEFNETNVISRVFFKDFWDLLSDRYNLYRLLPENAIAIEAYSAPFCEVFAFQNIVCVRKDFPPF
ncbi:MAG: FkbM family methyltransferase [Alphaproteobacteria bacterium]|nr:FkbM family methyltransferase [Alphaproteobacteria bacterium]